MSRELIKFDQGGDKQLVSIDQGTTLAFCRAASDALIENVIEEGGEEERSLVLSLKAIHSEIIGLDSENIRKLFKSYKNKAIELFNDDPRTLVAMSNLIGMASMMVYSLHTKERRTSIEETRERQLLTVAETPIRLIHEQRRTFSIEGGISALLAGGVAWLGKDLVNHGLNFGRDMSKVISDPFNYCTTLTEEKSYSWFYQEQTTRKIAIRDSGMICNALSTISGGLDNVVATAETSSKLSFLVVFIVLFIMLMTIFRIFRLSRMSVFGFKFSGSKLYRNDELMEMIDELADARISRRSPSRHLSSRRRHSPSLHLSSRRRHSPSRHLSSRRRHSPDRHLSSHRRHSPDRHLSSRRRRSPDRHREYLIHYGYKMK